MSLLLLLFIGNKRSTTRARIEIETKKNRRYNSYKTNITQQHRECKKEDSKMMKQKTSCSTSCYYNSYVIQFFFFIICLQANIYSTYAVVNPP